jgi:hypothetical protein
VARRIKAEVLPRESPGEPLKYGDVFRFHAPLAATSVMSLLGQPLIGAGLARMANPIQSLAAWPVIFGYLLIARSPSFALTEMVIALKEKADSSGVVGRFCVGVGVVTSGALGLCLLFPVVKSILLNFTGLTPDLADVAILGMCAGVALPLFQAVKNWQRGLLMAEKTTSPIYLGMALNLLMTGLTIGIGVVMKWPGAATAGAALAVAALCECVFLWYGLKESRRPALAAIPS